LIDSIEARSSSNIETLAVGLALVILETAELPLRELRLVIRTSKPLEARARAVSKPSPVLAPVTIANGMYPRLDQE
jgi:hypothetical protein